MTLSFSLNINRKPTRFVEKIIAGLKAHNLFNDTDFSDLSLHYAGFDIKYMNSCTPKIHSLRTDYGHRWKVGMPIHFVINNRTKNRLQFADTIPVVSIQEVMIDPYHVKSIHVWVKDHPEADDSYKNGSWKLLSNKEMEELAINDGFDSMEDFWNYFNRTFWGKIIHWTDKTY